MEGHDQSATSESSEDADLYTSRSPAEREAPNRQEAVPSLELVERHAPTNWKEIYDPKEFATALSQGEPFGLVVLAADIRRSTYLMREAVDFLTFASLLSAFVTFSMEFVRQKPNGWFDKFTGDGFLCYWVYEDGNEDAFRDAANAALGTAGTLLSTFAEDFLPEFRRSSRNFSNRVGLSVGLDAGPGTLVEVADDLTIVGQPVVGAVRMVDAAEDPWLLFSNVYLGEWLHRGHKHSLLNKNIQDVIRLYRSTKEARSIPEAEQQEIYQVVFSDKFFKPPG